MHFCANLCALHTLWFWLHVLGQDDATTHWCCMLVLPQDTTNCASTTALFAGSLLTTLWCGWHLGCHHSRCRLCVQRVACLVCVWFVSISWPGFAQHRCTCLFHRSSVLVGCCDHTAPMNTNTTTSKARKCWCTPPLPRSHTHGCAKHRCVLVTVHANILAVYIVACAALTLTPNHKHQREGGGCGAEQQQTTPRQNLQL